MTRLVTDKAKAFRALVEGFDGHQAAIAAALGVGQSAISQRLNSELHGAWWRAFKRKRAKRRRREASARYRARARERMRVAAGALPVTDRTQ